MNRDLHTFSLHRIHDRDPVHRLKKPPRPRPLDALHPHFKDHRAKMTAVIFHMDLGRVLRLSITIKLLRNLHEDRIQRIAPTLHINPAPIHQHVFLALTIVI